MVIVPNGIFSMITSIFVNKILITTKHNILPTVTGLDVENSALIVGEVIRIIIGARG